MAIRFYKVASLEDPFLIWKLLLFLGSDSYLGIAQQSTSCRVAQTLHCSTNLVTKCLEMLECVIKINGIDSIM